MDEKEYMKNYYIKNKSKLLARMKELRKINFKKYNTKHNEWREKNKEYLKQKNKEWYNKNKLIFNEKRREQFKNNKPIWATYEHRKEYLKKWQKQNREKNILYRLNSNISRRIRKDLHRFNLTKKESTQKLLPYTMQELKLHIEKQFTSEMNWENMGIIWEIDHSTPLSWAQTEKDILTLWELNNLRPLLKQENREKQDLYSGNISNTLSQVGR